MTVPTSVLLPGHDVPLGRYTVVRRLLPQRVRRMIGAWCFVDHFGPDDVSAGPGMQVPPHPHTGLQTVSWLAEGEILHRDSLGSLQSITPGQLNVMTSGHGISHSEESPSGPASPGLRSAGSAATGATREGGASEGPGGRASGASASSAVPHPPVMHGLQLWVALPDAARHAPPRFDHYPTLPVFADGDATVTVVVGSIGGETSPAVTFSPLVGAEIALEPGASVRLPLSPAFEYGVVSMAGSADVLGDDLKPGALLYLDRGRTALHLSSEAGARLFLLGGEPFDESLVMWWNFVGRSHDEILQSRADWEHSRQAPGARFGTVTGYAGDPLPAPEMPTVRLKARDRFGKTR